MNNPIGTEYAEQQLQADMAARKVRCLIHNAGYKAAAQLPEPLVELFEAVNQAYKKDVWSRLDRGEWNDIVVHGQDSHYNHCSSPIIPEDAQQFLLQAHAKGLSFSVTPKLTTPPGAATYRLHKSGFTPCTVMDDELGGHFGYMSDTEYHYEGLHHHDAVKHLSKDSGQFVIHGSDSGKFVPWRYAAHFPTATFAGYNYKHGSRTSGTAWTSDANHFSPDLSKMDRESPANHPVALAMQVNASFYPENRLTDKQVQAIVGPKWWDEYQAYIQATAPKEIIQDPMLAGRLATAPSRGAARGAYDDTN